MRAASSELEQALSSSMDVSYSADLYYDNARLFENLPIEAPSLDWDGTAKVEASGRVTVQWTDDFGTSLKPEDPQDWLAPFGSRLIIYCRIRSGVTDVRVQLGEYVITAVPRANDAPFEYGTTRVVIGSTVELVIKDRMQEVLRDRFTSLSSPTSLGSCWDEVGRISGLQLKRSIADSAITRAVVYDEDRTAAIADVLEIIGGVPFMDWDGTLSARSVIPGPVVTKLTVGDQGTIIGLGAALDSDEVYNGIVIRGETNGQQAILAEKWITEGPLRATTVNGARTPFHRKPRFYSSPFITTQDQAWAAIDGLLFRYSQPRASQVSIQCIVDPRLQVGDVVTAFDGESTWTVRLLKIGMGGGPYMTLLADVISRVSS